MLRIAAPSSSLITTTTAAPFSSKTRPDKKLLEQVKPDKESRKKIADYMELTKFKLSLLNSIGSYTMFYFHAPLAGVGLINSALFMFAT